MSATLAIECPNPGSRKPRSRGIAVGLVAALLVGLVYVGVHRSGDAVALPPAPPQIVGTFTGTYENGLPVYRLPPIQVTAVRE